MTSSTELRFTEDAQQDIDQIQQYTFIEWGQDQLEQYQSVLYNAFERIRSFPEIGRIQNDDTREYAIRQHVILYRYEDNLVTVLRVMHPWRLHD